MIYGIGTLFDYETFITAGLMTAEEQKEMRENGESPDGTLLLKAQAKLPKGFRIYYAYESNMVYVGKDPGFLKDSETGLEFKESVRKVVKDIFGERISKKCDWIAEEIEV
jgi:hypothetical protein